MIAIPHSGKRDVFVGGGGRRTSLDFSACLDHLANTLKPDVAKIVLVMDNLNTHKEASLYEAYLVRKNGESKSVNWQFTKERARIKLKSLFTIQQCEFQATLGPQATG